MTERATRRPGKKPLAARLAGVAIRAPKRILLAVGIAILLGAPIGLTAFGALDPYKFEDSGTDSAKASEALENVTGIRADGTVIAVVEGPARSRQGRRRVTEVATGLGEVEGVERTLTPYAPPQPALIARDGKSALVVAEVDADAESADVAKAVEEEFEGPAGR